MEFRSFWQYNGSQRGTKWQLRQRVVMGLMMLLLASGAGAEPLLDAAAIGDIREVKLYLDRGADVNVMDADNFSPLHWAAFGGYEEMVSLLVTHGATLNVQNDDGLTPLHTAVLAGHPEVVKQLLAFGANAETTTRNGNTARDMAVIRGRMAIVDIFDAPPTLVRYQAKASGAKAVKSAKRTKTTKTKPTVVASKAPSATPQAGAAKRLPASDQSQPAPRQTASLVSTTSQHHDNRNQVRLRSVDKPAPKAASTPDAQFLIQLASVRSQSAAERTWESYQKSFPDLLGANKLLVQRIDLAQKGTFYRVQTGPFAEKKQARAVCDHLKAHKKACLIVNY